MAKSIADYQKDWQAASARGDKAAMEAAHAGAEAVRAASGYSGGADGSQYIPKSTGTSVTPGYTPTNNGGTDYAKQVGMSRSDYQALIAEQQRYQKAQSAGNRSEMDAAHEAAEALRAKYQYSGGIDGSQYLPWQTDTGKFSGGSAPSYTEKYQGQIDSLMQQLLNRNKFSYNYLEDPLYQQYRDAYTREGTRAMQDTLGQSAARTGGYLSTAGEVAAQQANNYYTAKIGDKVPELEQLAYQMYLNDLDMDVQNLGLLNGLEGFNYDKYLTQLGQYNTDRNFNYGVYRDKVGDARYDSETEYERAAARAQLLAAAGDYSGYKALGYSDSDIATMQAASQLGRSSGGSSGGGSTGGGVDWTSVENWVSQYGEDAAADYIGENYEKLGYKSKSTALSAWKNHQMEREENDDGDGGLQFRNLGDTFAFTWRGKTYYSMIELQNALNNADLSEDEANRIREQLASYGFST